MITTATIRSTVPMQLATHPALTVGFLNLGVRHSGSNAPIGQKIPKIQPSMKKIQSGLAQQSWLREGRCGGTCKEQRNFPF